MEFTALDVWIYTEFTCKLNNFWPKHSGCYSPKAIGHFTNLRTLSRNVKKRHQTCTCSPGLENTVPKCKEASPDLYMFTWLTPALKCFNPFRAHHGDATPSAKLTLFECCNQKVYDRLRVVCQRISSVAGLAESLPCPGS